MNTQNELRAYSDGFTSRLDALFDELGIRQHGRGVQIAEWTGLSPSGARKMYSEDRPPGSSEALRKLVQGLQKAAERTGIKGVGESQIENFLLHAGPNPLKKAEIEKSVARKHFSSLGAVTQAKIYMLIDDDGKKRGVNIFDEITSEQLEVLIEKISEIHISQNLDVNSSQMVEIVGALIKLARSNVLI